MGLFNPRQCFVKFGRALRVRRLRRLCGAMIGERVRRAIATNNGADHADLCQRQTGPKGPVLIVGRAQVGRHVSPSIPG